MTQLRGGFHTNDPKLDRLPQFDERSREYPVRPLLMTVGKRRRSYTWRHVQLDQRNEGACTGFSVTMEAAARPVEVWGKDPDIYTLEQIARSIYNRAKQLDEWEGEAYEGSSVLGAMKAAIERRLYVEYRWALGPGPESAENDLALAVGYRGPAVLGTNWYTGMYTADADGFLKVTGSVEGGHAYVVTRYSVSRDAYWTPNSWGGSGQGWIRRTDMIRLLDEDGEACIPVRRGKKDS